MEGAIGGSPRPGFISAMNDLNQAAAFYNICTPFSTVKGDIDGTAQERGNSDAFCHGVISDSVLSHRYAMSFFSCRCISARRWYTPLFVPGIKSLTLVSNYIDGLVRERRNSSALAMELRLSCTNPSILSQSQGMCHSDYYIKGPVAQSVRWMAFVCTERGFHCVSRRFEFAAFTTGLEDKQSESRPKIRFRSKHIW